MRVSPGILLLWCLVCGCGPSGPEPQPSSQEAAPKKAPALPAPEPGIFPKANLVSTSVAPAPLFGNSSLPAGNTALYKKGDAEFSLFAIRTKSPQDAAFLLLDLKATLSSPKVIPHFGGFFGNHGNTPVFAFAKNNYLLGIRGLSEPQADRLARDFAALIR